MEVHLIAAMTRKGVIGNNGSLPWHIPTDLQHFKKLTSGYPVIMGRKTFDSLNMLNGLPNRHNIVITSKSIKKMPHTSTLSWASNLRHAITSTIYMDKWDKCFIIGGASIYKQALDEGLVHVLDLSFIKNEYEGDTQFPGYNRMEWVEETSHEFDEFNYVRYIKENNNVG